MPQVGSSWFELLSAPFEVRHAGPVRVQLLATSNWWKSGLLFDRVALRPEPAPGGEQQQQQQSAGGGAGGLLARLLGGGGGGGGTASRARQTSGLAFRPG